jgi:hypothetical protein
LRWVVSVAAVADWRKVRRLNDFLSKGSPAAVSVSA